MRARFVIDSAQVAGDLTDFVVYVDLSLITEQAWWDTVTASGGDIRVYKSDAATELPREVVAIDTALKTGSVHVKYSGTTSSSMDTEIVLDVDGTRSDYADTATFGAQNVWGNGFFGVYHLQDVAFTADGVKDSTGNQDGTTQGSMTGADNVAGMLGAALDFDGTDDGVDIAGVAATGSTTLSEWINADTWTAGAGNTDELIQVSGGPNLEIFNKDGTDLRLTYFDGTGHVVDAALPPTGTDTLVTGVWDEAAGVMSLYVNGALAGSAAYSFNLSVDGTSSQIGNHSTGRPFDGIIDEARISSVARSADWIATTYANQSSPAIFFSSVTIDPVGEFKVEVTVQSTQVDEDVTDFPVYVDLSDLPVGFWDHVFDGEEIRVFTSDGAGGSVDELPREVVAIDKTAETGEVHFKAALSSTTDTLFFIHYGLSGVGGYADSAPLGAQNVWTNGYAAVCHMSTGGVLDSTANGNNGTNHGTSSALGQVGDARHFNVASGEYIEVPYNASLDNPSAFTLSAWAKSDINGAAYTDTGFIIDIGSVAPRGYGIRVSASLDTLGAYYNQFQLGSIAVVADTWVYLTQTYDNTTIRIYGNGILNDSAVSGTATIDDNPLRIGAQSKNLERFFDGTIDEVRLSSVARSAGWVSTEYNNQSSPSTFYTVGAEIEIPTTITGAIVGRGGTLAGTLEITPRITGAIIGKGGTLAGEIDVATFFEGAIVGKGGTLGGILRSDVGADKALVRSLSTGNVVSFRKGSLSVTARQQACDDASFSVALRPGEPLPLAVGETVALYPTERAVTPLFAGTVDRVQVQEIMGTRSLDASLADATTRIASYQATCFSRLAERHLVAEIYESTTAQAIVQDIITDILSEDGVTEGQVEEGTEITSILFNYKKAADALTELAELSGYTWYIDPDKALHFFGAGQRDVVHTIDADNMPYASLSVKRGRQNYRNKQYVRAGKDLTPARTETFIGDGEVRTFTVQFPIGEEPTVEVNSVAKVVGIGGVEEVGDWFWNKSEKTVTQDDDLAALTAADTLEVTYRGLVPIIVEATSIEAITERQAVEGGSGIYEGLEDIPDVQDRDLAVARASSLLRRYARLSEEVTLTLSNDPVLLTSFRQGQVVAMELPAYDLSGEYLIDSVQWRVRDDDTLQASTTLLAGESFGGWTKYFRALQAAGRSYVIRENEVLITQRSAEATIVMTHDVNLVESAPGLFLIGTSTVNNAALN